MSWGERQVLVPPLLPCTTDSKDRRARQAALMQWRTVVRKSRPYTQAWFRGKLGVATAHFDLNDRKHAQDMIELLMSLHPKMGGPELKRDFTSLLQRCRQ